MRASLTTLGIIIGVGAVIAMVTLGNGATASITTTIGSLGQNLLILRPGNRGGPGGPGGPRADAPPFDQADSAAILREVTGLRAAAPLATRSEVVVIGNRNHTTQITGTVNSYLEAREWPLNVGRVFTDAEINSGRAVCILGETVRRELFGAQHPLGVEIRVGPVPCEVIGVLVSKGQSTFGQDHDDIILMPLRAVQRRLAGNTNVGTIWLATNRPDDTNKVIDDVTRLMRERRHLSEGGPQDFEINDMQETANVMQQTTAILTIFLAAIAAVSLLVGGIGIMNIMLVSVTERTREIGIRLAIGALERDVLMQFLVEAVMMSALGGVAGVALGLGTSAIAVYFLGIPFVPSAAIVVIAVLFSAGIGVAFGYFPARRAARLDPIEALRHE